MSFDTETQAIMNTLVLQRNAALDQLALLTGRVAVLESDLKAALETAEKAVEVAKMDKQPGEA